MIAHDIQCTRLLHVVSQLTGAALGHPVSLVPACSPGGRVTPPRSPKPGRGSAGRAHKRVILVKKGL